MFYEKTKRKNNNNNKNDGTNEYIERKKNEKPNKRFAKTKSKCAAHTMKNRRCLRMKKTEKNVKKLNCTELNSKKENLIIRQYVDSNHIYRFE